MPGGYFCSPLPLEGCWSLTPGEEVIVLHSTRDFLQCSRSFCFFSCVRCEEKSDRGSRQGAFETLCLNSGLFYPLFQSFVESHSNEHWGHKNRYSENRGGFACLINLAHIPLSETRYFEKLYIIIIYMRRKSYLQKKKEELFVII